MVHDLLLSKRGIVGHPDYHIRQKVERHKTRLKAEFTKIRVQRGCATIEGFRKAVNEEAEKKLSFPADHGEQVWQHPRWIRINTLITTLEEQMKTTFKGYREIDSIENLVSGTAIPNERSIYHIDRHIPDLIALPPSANFSESSAYDKGMIIFQDKASCFPAYLLGADYGGDIIDACAAPGNKTTHLAAIRAASSGAVKDKIWACERDKYRAKSLKKMVSKAGADAHVDCMEGQDFLKLDPKDTRWENVTALLLDPSCSGSGIVGRDNMPQLMVPAYIPGKPPQQQQKTNKKRKRESESESSQKNSMLDTPDEVDVANPFLAKDEARLASLSAFQLQLLRHAFEFPASRITYSTCSIHAEENEHVVMKALGSKRSQELGWRIMKREDQVAGMKAWEVRGDAKACEENAAESDESSSVIADACIRCNQGTKQGTMGFFVAGFVRDQIPKGSKDSNERIAPGSWDDGEEWEGFSDI